MSERTYTAIIVDDEDLARAVVAEHLAVHPEIRVVASCPNGFEAVKACAEHRPDLMFLDIQMPKLTGFEVLEILDPQPTVVFITAYDQHALKAFEVHAVDYLLKPFSADRFEEALVRAKARCDQGDATGPQPTVLHDAARSDWPLDRLVVKDGAKVSLVPLAKLDYVQAQDDYVLLKTAEKSHLKQQTISSLEQRLDPKRFLRIHRSFIIQLDRLARLEQTPSESWVAVLTDGNRLPVSKSGYARLKTVLDQSL
ncbi:LytR/AlgR family response regulator transcription factor [Mesoterricola sediminis]|uniref:DNA-binding response regulator n=1 Tax=Mesoterricola sediminis TaxID=2927980 RepID=A0AA48KDJ3_9BACT|nr:response regulator [Mesoterricola sediminis]BDU76387.1 DNA-binding response regulator [Mesoterricola sediminis]